MCATIWDAQDKEGRTFVTGSLECSLLLLLLLLESDVVLVEILLVLLRCLFGGDLDCRVERETSSRP